MTGTTSDRTDAHRDRVVEAALAAGRRAPEPADTTGVDLRVGDDVEHPTFGEGVVLELRGRAEALEATVNFRGVGMKHLALGVRPAAQDRPLIRSGSACVSVGFLTTRTR